MKIIGITGGIGSGKSVILSIMKQEYEAYIVETDRLAERLMQPGEDLYQAIVAAFAGEAERLCPDSLSDRNFVLGDGKINRPLLANLVFHSPEALDRLNGLTHPAVKRAILTDIDKQCRAEQENGSPQIYVIEAALLIEDGYKQICDELWYIYAEEKVRIERLMKGRGYSYEKCLDIIRNQSSEDYYRKHTDRVIDNSGDLEQATKELEKIMKIL